MMDNDMKNTENQEEFEDILEDTVELDGEQEESSLQGKIKDLRQKLTACEDEKRSHLEELQRTRADFLNSRRRLEEQLARDKERAADKILTELLTLIDSFDTAMVDKELWNTIDEKWRVGVEAIHAKLLSILKSNNVIQTDPLGLTFNPEEHEAVSEMIVNEESKVNTIVAVLQKGYTRNGITIRPAKVVVGTKST